MGADHVPAHVPAGAYRADSEWRLQSSLKSFSNLCPYPSQTEASGGGRRGSTTQTATSRVGDVASRFLPSFRYHFLALYPRHYHRPSSVVFLASAHSITLLRICICSLT